MISHDILPPHEWVYLNDDGNYQLRDPVSRGDLKPDEAPDFIAQDERLILSPDVVHELSQSALAVFYTGGERTRQDVNGSVANDSQSEYNQLVYSPANRVGAVGHTVDPTIQAYRSGGRLVVARSSNGGDYVNRLFKDITTADPRAYAASLETFAAGLEINEDGQPATVTEDALFKINREVAQYGHEFGKEDGAYIAINAISKHMQQWYRVLRARQQLGILLDHGLQADSIVIAAPVSDIDYHRKFGKIGMIGGWENPEDIDSPTKEPIYVEADSDAFRRDKEAWNAVQWDAKAMRQGYISLDMLA